MSPDRNSELDSLIADITVDCYNDDEQLTAFEAAFDNATLPCPGRAIGEKVSVISIGVANGRRELMATCERNGHRYQMALLDIELNGDPTIKTLVAAYRRWNSS
jgi:hypothetical protein